MYILSALSRGMGVVSVVAAMVLGCAPPMHEAEDRVAIPPGKADNYLSPVVQEYDIQGQARLVLADADAALTGEERDERVADLARELTDRITNGLDSRLGQLFPHDDQKEDDGVIVMLRESSTSSDNLVADGEAAYTFLYNAEAAATDNLLPFEDGTRELEVKVSNVGTEDTAVQLHFSASAVVRDTYPRYRELFQDGLDIYIHYGGDYNESRWDIKKSRAMFDKLKALGFTAPVESYDDLKLDSGPFVGQLDVAGESVEVRVKMVHPEMVSDEELDQLVDSYKKYAGEADVVIYAGHASEDTGYSGVVVHYNPRKALRATEFKDLTLPDRYQIFVFSGCYTYTGYADQLLENPAKTADNVDVVTAVSSTPLSRDIVHVLLQGLLAQEEGTWFPHSWGALLRRLNQESERSWRAAFGVHGLEGNPKVSPLADLSTVGKACTTSDECPGIDNLCVRPFIFLKRVCGVACTDDSGCPAGARCWWSFSTASGLPARQCVKLD
jgi:hypothetical protein